MACKSCGSNNQGKYSAEMNLHFPGYAGLEKRTVWVFPEVVVCIDCGFSEFSVAKRELCQLAEAAGT